MEQLTLFDIEKPQVSRFYNTTNLSGPELKMRQMRAGSQNERVLEYLKNNPEKSVTPWDIVRAFGWPERMKVSAGRCLTTLTKLGYLKMTGERRMEICGDINNCWRLK